MPEILKLGFTKFTCDWHDNNVVQKNNKGYPIRLFPILLQQEPTEEAALTIARQVAAVLTELTQNSPRTVVNESNFIFKKKVVWSDLVGNDKALALIQQLHGFPTDNPSFWKDHGKSMCAYFHPRTYSRELAAILHAPTEMIHPDLLDPKEFHDDGDTSTQENTMDESDADSVALGDTIQLQDHEYEHCDDDESTSH